MSAQEIRPFTLAIAQSEIDDLHRRLDRTRWPEHECVDDWSQGAPLDAVRSLVDYWRNGYDWRRCEVRLNRYPQFVTEIDGLDVCFLHVRSPHEGARPLILTHGWPGSVIEFLDCIEPLTDPTAHGGKAEDAFHVVIPALPGFGFSGKPTRHGWGVEKIATAWAELMTRLGYTRWFAQGGDWGSVVTAFMGEQAPAGLAGIHLNMALGRPGENDGVSPEEAQKAGELFAYYQQHEAGYSTQQSTRPQTVGYSLVDSPVGLAAWIYEKYRAWTDNSGVPEDALSRDTMLDNIMLYWLPAAGASAARIYWESFTAFSKVGDVNVPAGFSNFPRELTFTPRPWAANIFKDIRYWNDASNGGHFAAWEQPEIFVSELRACFATMG